MKSCIYEGTVRHRRTRPVTHEVSKRLFLMYLDLAELPDLFRGRLLWSATGPSLAWFRRADHLGDPEVPLDQAVRELVEQRTGHRPRGPIRLLTHMRYFGHGFNPVSFYYCWDEDGREVETVVAEVNNTPWGEQHCYVLEEGQNLTATSNKKRYRFGKDFHVSPFMAMEQTYDWRFVRPGERLVVHTENHDAGGVLLDATLTLSRREIGTRSLTSALIRFPLMTVQVVAAVYLHVLQLWLARAPFFPHPRHRTDASIRPAER